MKVSIIIVTYNTKDLTQDCIGSVQKYTSELDYEIILVDNASSDGSKEFFDQRTDINYIYSTENLGFGRANNLGAEKATGEYIFFLNSDTLLKENSVKKLSDFFTENEERLKIGSLGCRLIDRTGEFNGDGSIMPSCDTEIVRYKKLIPIVKYLTSKVERVSNFNFGQYYEIGYVIGADLMMKTEVFRNLQGFDPHYFMYYEESDLQYRMRALGYCAYIFTGTEIIHLEDGSGKKIKKYSNRKRIMSHTSKNIFLKKNDSANFDRYKLWDRLYLYLSNFSKNYTKEEKMEFESAVKKTH